MPEQFSLSTQQRDTIHTILSIMADKVSAHIRDTELPHGLLSGLAGQLLFLYKAYEYDASLVDEALFAQKLEELQEGLDQQSFELSNGLAGQAWLLEYLNQSDQENYDPELLEEIDELFRQSLDHQPWRGEIEMVLGLSGFAPYAARRSRQSDQSALYEVIVNGLESTATHFDNGHIAWSQPEESVYRFNKDEPKEPEYNLGLAHGVPGIIAALLPAVHIPSLKERVTKLLLGGCDWLLEQQSPDSDSHSCFGSCAGNDHQSRLGWCYGDLTIAMTLARVGQALDRPSYIERALEIGLHAAGRDEKSGHITDAGVCHGYYGMALIYQILNQLMPHPRFVQAMQYWVDYSLAQYAERGVESLYSFNGIDKEYHEDFGFLMGYAGIGAALTSLFDDDTGWVDCLLMA
ncbi:MULTISPECIES: lanthionine synthetase C family protein [unclassified Pseudoalteromonas]|uniref:lanthionine synthetase C family protein n=1 Tax=unclassified Pseudoalteromonas TaxID=194690 RepID=UPI002098361C|nr:lanthionine synthetase C family protein [Pseudoalteromonas sp. XMcav2-N]MCO7190189.1 lanthionine synthetase C family protein [Pseudoalteromonas sp. XMcav2-N]